MIIILREANRIYRSRIRASHPRTTVERQHAASATTDVDPSLALTMTVSVPRNAHPSIQYPGG